MLQKKYCFRALIWDFYRMDCTMAARRHDAGAGISVTDSCILMAFWGPELSSVEHEFPSAVHQPSFSMKPLAKFERGGSCKETVSLYLVAGEGVDPKQCPSWGQGRDSSSLAQFGAAKLSVKVLLGPGWDFAHAMLPPSFHGYGEDVGKPVMCQGCSKTGNTHL